MLSAKITLQQIDVSVKPGGAINHGTLANYRGRGENSLWWLGLSCFIGDVVCLIRSAWIFAAQVSGREAVGYDA